jgi:RNA polymerase sigma factor (sigma-70 family)
MPEAANEAVLRQIHALFREGRVGEFSDAELLARFIAGPESLAAVAFAELVERHGPMVLRLCRRVVGDQHEAEDAAQAAFLVLARRARAIRNRESVASWLFGTARRIALRSRAKRSRRLRVERQWAEMSLRTSPASGAPAREKEWPELYEEIDRLPERLRTPLILAHLEGLTHEQTASRLRVPLRTLQRRLVQGHERLRARMIERPMAPAVGLLTADAALDALGAELSTTWLTKTITSAVQISVHGTAKAASAKALVMMEDVMRARLQANLMIAAASITLATVIVLGLSPFARGRRAAAARTNGAKTIPTTNEVAKLADEPDKPCEVTVLAKDTGKPIAGATLRYLIDMRHVESVSDKNGRAVIPLDRQTFSRGRLSLDVWADGYVQQRHQFANSDKRQLPVPERLTVTLLPATETFGGIVTNEAGQPVAGATVELWGYLAKKEDPHELAFKVRSATDNQGRWRNRNLRPMTFINLYITHPDYLGDDDLHARRVGEPNGAVVPSFADFQSLQRKDVLTRGIEITGRVIDDDSRPIAGAVVGWVSNQSTFNEDMPQTTTDVDGRYRFAHARRGTGAVIVKAVGRAPRLKEIEIAPGLKPVEFQLSAGNSLEGNVVDGEGKPISNVFVNIDTWRRYRCLGVFLSTDSDGRFHWADAPPDEVLVNATKSGRVSVIQQRMRADGSEHRITLFASLEVSGTIKDAETGKRVDNVLVESGPVNQDTGEVGWAQDRGVFAFSGQLIATFNASNGKAFKIRVSAGGYETVVSPDFRVADGNATFNFELRKAKGADGLVLGPDGQPIAGATVVLIPGRNGGLVLRAGKPEISNVGGLLVVKTEQTGALSIPKISDRYLVVAASDQYYGEATKEQLENTHTLQLAPWGRIEGMLKIGSQPAAGAEVELRSESSDRFPGIHITVQDQQKTDANGRFVFERVVPGGARISRRVANGPDLELWDIGRLFSVNSGETTRAQVGGLGRPVTGQLVAPPGTSDTEAFFHDYEIHLESNWSYFPYPLELIRTRQWSAWGHAWRESPAGRAYLQDFVRRALRVGKDGSFRFDDVPEGVYWLHARLRQTLGMRSTLEQHSSAPTYLQTFRIAAIPGGQSDAPQDLGRCEMWTQRSPEVGAPAPDFKVTTLDGREVSLADYRGHFLLLDFGSPSSQQSRFQVERLEKLATRFQNEDRLVILSFTVDSDTPETRDYITEKHQNWRQAIIGPVSPENAIARSFDIGMGELGRNGLPREFLIGPDGKLVAKDLFNNNIEATVAQALEKP